MPLAGGHGLLRIRLVLRDVRARAVFAHAKPAVTAVIAVLVQQGTEGILGTPAGIPARINVPAKQVGNLVHLRHPVRAGRANGRPRRVFAVGGVVQIHQFPVRIRRFTQADFVEQAPAENGRVVDVLPDEIQQLVARGLGEFGSRDDFVDLRDFRPHEYARPVAQAVKIIAVLVMAAADNRRADFQDQVDVLPQVRLGNRPALYWPVLMLVDAVQMIRLAVQEKSEFGIHAIKPQAQRLRDRINHGIRCLQFHNRAVKIRILAPVPQMRMPPR